MVFYSDLYKNVDTLLKDQYKSLGSVSFKTKSTTCDGVKLQFDAKKKNGKQDVTGGFKFCQNYKRDDLNLNVDARISQEGNMNEKCVLSGIAKGFKIKSDVTLLQGVDKVEKKENPKDEKKVVRNSGKLTFVYETEDKKFGTNVSLSKKSLSDPKIVVDFAGKVHDNVALGLKVSAPLRKLAEDAKYQKILDTDFTAKLSTDDVTVVGVLSDAGRKANLGLVSNVNDKLDVGVEFTNTNGLELPWCFKGEKAEETKEEEEKEEKRSWGFTVGFSLKGDNNTQLNGKINQSGTATVSYDFDLKEKLRSSLSVETDVSKLGSGSKLGVSFTYSE